MIFCRYFRQYQILYCEILSDYIYSENNNDKVFAGKFWRHGLPKFGCQQNFKDKCLRQDDISFTYKLMLNMYGIVVLVLVQLRTFLKLDV